MLKVMIDVSLPLKRIPTVIGYMICHSYKGKDRELIISSALP
jgi:hypothetical protein